MDKSSPNYLLQNLNDVYTDPDPRTYPLSSYVYEIEPTGTSAQDSKITHGEAADDRRLHLLLDLPGPEGDRPDRLLAAAGQPGRGRLRPDRQAQEGRPDDRPHRPQRQDLQQPDFHRGPPEHELPGQDRAAAAVLRQDRRRSVRGRRDAERHRQDADHVRHRARLDQPQRWVNDNSSGSSGGSGGSSSNSGGSGGSGRQRPATSSSTSGTHTDPSTGQQVGELGLGDAPTRW